MSPDLLARHFEPQPASVALVRHCLREALDDVLTGEPQQELADSLVLAVNELATNAVMHARTEFTVRLSLANGLLRIEVEDGNPRLGQACLAPADATSGRGLAIVEGTGLDWGVERSTGGKIVWLQSDVLAGC
ncbi:MAG TPA: ATP-binding protein [Sporichthya sp.]|nr:ATP-binding protein [Sporichthya sp.]